MNANWVSCNSYLLAGLATSLGQMMPVSVWMSFDGYLDGLDDSLYIQQAQGSSQETRTCSLETNRKSTTYIIVAYYSDFDGAVY